MKRHSRGRRERITDIQAFDMHASALFRPAWFPLQLTRGISQHRLHYHMHSCPISNSLPPFNIQSLTNLSYPQASTRRRMNSWCLDQCRWPRPPVSPVYRGHGSRMHRVQRPFHTYPTHPSLTHCVGHLLRHL